MLIIDPRTNKLIVRDLADAQNEIRQMLELVDVSVFISRVFRIQKADVQFMGETLATMKSPAAPAPIVDPRTRQIIVFDRIEIIRQMELIVETLDVDAP